MQTSKRAARELALNILYQVDVTDIPLDEAIKTAEEQVTIDPEVFAHAESLARGVNLIRKDLDKKIRKLSTDWPPARQPAVDRNILRLAMYEISKVESTPVAVAVNEAVEMAKKFSTEDSGKFINGVLAAYLRDLEKSEPVQPGAND